MSDPEQPRNASASSPGDDAEKPTIGLSGAVAIDAVCDEFEAAWKAGRDEPPELVEYYRRGVEVGVDAELLALELLLIDRAYRRRIGNELSRAVYRELLPGLEGTIDQAFEPESQSMRTAAPAEMNTLAGDAISTGVGDRVRYFGDYELLEEIARGG